ncbi:MAG: toll/interleukin-1 receptor domain-containing protein [Gammaproteobacteria bacterium]|nr:toll/interleukin-1 receptor domain-containing protein [Gammaproteobacteria bacterium]
MAGITTNIRTITVKTFSGTQLNFDVFLCHNSEDKPEVKNIGAQLKHHGLRPWLDEWELRPGLPWQRLLEENIEKIDAAAVFVGPLGIGPWQQLELEAYLRQFVKRNCPVIPVILKGTHKLPKLPVFLEGLTWVDFRQNEPDPLERLIWGITGKRCGSGVTHSADNGTDQAGEYAYEDDWVVQMIDHNVQRGKVLDHFDPTSSGQPDRAYFYFKATPDDYPLALADHTYIEFARFAPETESLATELRRCGQGRNAIWKALLQKLPGGRDQESRQEAQQRVLDWINSRRLTVLYIIVDAEQDRKHLPEMIKGACAALDALPRFQEGVRLILFFACLKTRGKRSIFRLISGLIPGSKITDMCCTLDPLRELNRVDIEEWLSGFTPEQERRYHKERLRVELGELLKEQERPYKTVRGYLIDGGVLRRARR